MKRLALLLLLVACSEGPPPYARSVGILQPHERMIVRIARGTVNAYAPAAGQARNLYTVEAFAQGSPEPPAPTIRALSNGIEVDATSLRSLLVRVPDGVDLTVISGNGNVTVTDISGNATVRLGDGSATLMLNGYARASIAGRGTLNVIMGSESWPGRLRFFDADGDVDLSINENARFQAHLHTADGTIFTDFALRGMSQGKSESIDGDVNGGAPRSVDVESGAGVVRLLRLGPQM